MNDAFMQNAHALEPIKTIARMRGIRDAIAYMKKTDTGSAVTYGFIRKLCDNKEIKCIRAGRKILVNLDEILNYFNTGAGKHGDHS